MFLQESYDFNFLNEDIYTEEGLELLSESSNKLTHAVYILLTDTKTQFSRLSKLVTRDPYNHVSISFDRNFKEIYTYALQTAKNGIRGGVKKESRRILKGAQYALYKINVTNEVYEKIKTQVKYFTKHITDTSYNHLALLNTIFQKEIFKSRDKMQMICSQFIAVIFESAGVQLLKDRAASTIKPYEFVKSKLLKFVEEGIIR